MKYVSTLFPPYIKCALEEYENKNVEEIRLCAGSPFFIYADGREHILYSGAAMVTVSMEDIDFILKRATGNSLYAYGEDIKNGFITVRGGHRIGITGRAVYEKNKILAIRDISGINIRIAGIIPEDISYPADFLYKNGELKNTLIVSPPKCGKTTLLREIVRIASDRGRERVVLIDERDELASVYEGVSHYDVGKRTLVLSGYGKREGFSHAIRGLSPTLIACDEIGGEEDRKVITEGIKRGVKIIATLHGEAQSLKNYKEAELFERFILLDKSFTPSFYEKRGDDIYEL
ncbi:MAG: stage III sporulation protein AA [Ruminococcaceae bacterium]|nr:stage III sporulation protein AA [Oscillospiraceae bacterium]